MTAELGVSANGKPVVLVLPYLLGARPLLSSLQHRVAHKRQLKGRLVPRQLSSRLHRQNAPCSAQGPLAADSMAEGPVFLFAPNLVGYFRLCLLAGSLVTGTAFPAATLFLLCFNLLLDGLDGYLARHLGQASSFGAFLDVLVDNITRGIFYVWAFDGPAGAFFLLLEMLSFLCTHRGGGAAWKTGYFSNSPWWVQKVMENGFRTPQGSLTVFGLMGCPVWLWTRRWYPSCVFASPFFAVPVVAGRCLAGAVEAWVIVRHIQGMLREDAQAHHSQAGKQA